MLTRENDVFSGIIRLLSQHIQMTPSASLNKIEQNCNRKCKYHCALIPKRNLLELVHSESLRHTGYSAARGRKNITATVSHLVSWLGRKSKEWKNLNLWTRPVWICSAQLDSICTWRLGQKRNRTEWNDIANEICLSFSANLSQTTLPLCETLALVPS